MSSITLREQNTELCFALLPEVVLQDFANGQKREALSLGFFVSVLNIFTALSLEVWSLQ